jgi:hypothetical protein
MEKRRRIKNKPNNKKRTFIIIIIVIFILSIGFIVLLSNFIKLRNELNERYNIFVVNQKIYYLINKSNNLKYLENYYKTNDNKELKEVIDKLSYNIYINCNKFNISTDLMIALINNESQFCKYAKSRIEKKNREIDSALGYCQIYLTVWKNIIPCDADIIFDEYENLYWGCYILNFFYEKNNKDLQNTLIAYNGGYKNENESYVTINKVTYVHISKIENDMIQLSLLKIDIFDYFHL